MEIITVKALSFRYPKTETDVLRNLTFSLSPGEFVTLCGPSGCGKSTLLRQLKGVFASQGVSSGEILFAGKPFREIDERTQSAEIGFVGQSPDNQIVTDKVWHELAFGLESLGLDSMSIRSRVAETASFFGMQTWFEKSVAELSGGQKQLLNLASVMVMEPQVLLLDEPTSQLDPIAAGEFLLAVGRINRELGITVLMTEHRLEEVLPYSNRMLVMESGCIVADDTPDKVGLLLRECGNDMFFAMPTPMRIWSAVPDSGERYPWTVGDGRIWLENYAQTHTLCPLLKEETRASDIAPSLEIEQVWFRYEKQSPDVLKGVSMRAYPGELLAVLGGNGTGKSTMLSLVTGANRPYRGSLRINGRPIEKIPALFNGLLGVLPQNPQSLFTQKTVWEDLLEVLEDKKMPKEQQQKKVEAALKLCDLEKLSRYHPYDLSGGEQQRAALAKILLLEPSILLLDEPTKGMDISFKYRFAGILQKLLQQDVTIVMVSHDVEFCARYANQCVLFFNGTVVAENTPRAFFSNNSFYTTSACRMAKNMIAGAVTAEDVILACGGQIPPDDHYIPPSDKKLLHECEDHQMQMLKQIDKTSDIKLRVWQRLLAGAGIIFAVLAVFHAMNLIDVSMLTGTKDWTLYLLFGVSFALFACAFWKKTHRPISEKNDYVKRKRLPKRTIFAVIVIFIAIPITIFMGVFYLGDKKYLLISLLVMLEGMLPFFVVFEGRKPKARELVVIAVLCAMGIAGRSIFYILPQFKPVAALTIIAGVSFGGETGFLVGALTMLTSNILFGQGPWTPWQMFAMGMIGFLAGIFYRIRLIGRSRISLCIFGFFAALVIYGGIMNPASAILFHSTLNWSTLLAYFVTGLPMDMVHAAATVVFLFFLAEPMQEKLDRVKTKYGLMV